MTILGCNCAGFVDTTCCCHQWPRLFRCLLCISAKLVHHPNIKFKIILNLICYCFYRHTCILHNVFNEKRSGTYLNVHCELGTITHKLLWQMFSSSSHSQQLSSAAAWLGTEFLWLWSRKLYSGLITVITVIPPIIGPRGHTHYDLYSYHQGAAELLQLLGYSSC